MLDFATFAIRSAEKVGGVHLLADLAVDCGYVDGACSARHTCILQQDIRMRKQVFKFSWLQFCS